MTVKTTIGRSPAEDPLVQLRVRVAPYVLEYLQAEAKRTERTVSDVHRQILAIGLAIHTGASWSGE